MLTRVYISLLTFLFVLGTLGVSNAMAQKYTTQSSSSTASSSSKAKVEQCTVQDLRAIKKFDSVAKRKIKKAQESIDYERETPRAAQKHANERLKAISFFSSDEYFQMKPVYKRCGKKIPIYYKQSSFWLPDEMGGTCPTCAK